MKFTSLIFICLLFFVGFLPQFGAIDRMAFQWFFLAIINFISFSYVYFLRPKLISSTGIFRSEVIILFSILQLLGIISFFFSINIVESLIEISKSFILFSSLLNFFLLLKMYTPTYNAFFRLIFAFIIIELIFFYFNFYISSSLKGMTANVNILAFSVLFKVPFILYCIYNKQKAIFCYPLLILSISIILIIASRGALLGLFFIFLIYSTFYIKKYNISIISLSAIFISYFFSAFMMKQSSQTAGKLLNLTLDNESTNQRLLFYKGALESLFSSPLGIGIGNWKIISISYYNEFMQSYIVPYHVHNDFLEIGAELGIFGIITYFLIFFLIFRFLYFKLFVYKQYVFLPIACSFFVFFLDSNLNFPISRPIIAIQFLFIIAFIIYNQNFKPLNAPKSIFLIFLFLLPFAGYSSYKVFKSLILQDYLYNDFTSQNYNTPPEIYNQIDPDYPNLAATTLPVKSLLANYYSNDSVINKYLDQSINENPFIKYPQVLKSIRFTVNQELDSALFYAKDAFFEIPNNELHSINYLSVLTSLKDSLEIKNVFNKYKSSTSENFWNAYFLSLLKLKIQPNDSILSEINEAKVKFSSSNIKWNLYELRFTKGKEIINQANELFISAEDDFKNSNFQSSYSKFMKASSLIPEDPAYLENAAHSLYLLNQNNRALKLFDSVINNYSNSTGKAHYLKGLMLFETKGNKKYPCQLFNIAISKGNKDAIRAKQLICN